MKVSVQTAQDTLTDLLDAATAGEEIVIAREGKPSIKLVPVDQPAFRLGMWEGQFGEGPDFFEPMSEEDLALWEGTVEPSSP